MVLCYNSLNQEKSEKVDYIYGNSSKRQALWKGIWNLGTEDLNLTFNL